MRNRERESKDTDKLGPSGLIMRNRERESKDTEKLGPSGLIMRNRERESKDTEKQGPSGLIMRNREREKKKQQRNDEMKCIVGIEVHLGQSSWHCRRWPSICPGWSSVSI